MAVTHKDGGVGWAIDDAVDELYGSGSSTPFALDPKRELVIGAEDCDIVLDDATRCVSRRHARLMYEAGRWTILDLESTNGIWQDGERRLSFQLVPGVKIQIGGVTLVAHSPRLRHLRDYLARLIGWNDARRADVARAVDAVRESSRSQTALAIYGAGDLTRIARRIHSFALGEDRPFMVAAERVVPQLGAVRGGTLCVIEDNPPRDHALLGAKLRAGSGSETPHVTVCGKTRDVVMLATRLSERAAIIEIPPLQRRLDEQERLLWEYIDDAVIALAAPSSGLLEHDMHWLRQVPLTDHEELEDLGLRIVAHRNWGASGGGQRLGISHVALSKWLGRRNIPT